MGRFSKANREALNVVDRFVEALNERELIHQQQHSDALRLRRQGVSVEEIRKQLPDYSPNKGRKIRRSVGGVGQARPAFYAPLIEKFFDKFGDDFTLEDVRNKGRSIQEALMIPQIRGPYNVGHHAQGLMSIFSSLQQFPRKFQHQVLDILETELGFRFGDESLNYIKNLSHKLDDITKLRGDWSKALGGIGNLDEINPKLRELLKPLMAHADRFGGTTGVMPSELVKNMTDPKSVAMEMLPWLDQNQAGLEQSIVTSKAIEKYGMKDGKIIKDNFKPGGIVEQELAKLQPTGGGESVIKTRQPRSQLLRRRGLQIGTGLATTGGWALINQPSMHAAGTGINALQQGDTETAKAQIEPFVKGVRDDLGWQAGLALAGGVAAKNATVRGIGGKILGGPVGWAAMAHGVYQAADAFTQGYSGRDIGDHFMEKSGYAKLLKLDRKVDNEGKVTYEKNTQAQADKQKLFDILNQKQVDLNQRQIKARFPEEEDD